MTDAYCPKDDSMLREYCSHCRGLDPSPNKARSMDKRHDGGVEAALVHDLDESKWFEATHHGECNQCFKKIKPGDRIRWDSDYPGARACCD